MVIAFPELVLLQINIYTTCHYQIEQIINEIINEK